MSVELKDLLWAMPVVAVGVLEEEAEAAVRAACPGPGYYDPCYYSDGWTDVALLSGGTIPADGVLVLQGAWVGPSLPDASTISLTADAGTDAEPVTGTVQATEFPGILTWRPDAPWVPGTTYTIAGAVTNANADECIQAELPLAGEVTIAAEPAGPLTAVDIAAVEMLEQVPEIGLDTLACCPGASPTRFTSGCQGDGPFVDFDPEQCAPTSQFGFLQLTLTGTAAADDAHEQQVVYVLRTAGVDEVSFAPMFGRAEAMAPACFAIDAVDLGTGAAVKGAEECFGAEFAGQVGSQPLDPKAALGCDPVVCAVTEDGWDLEMCTPFGEGGEAPTGGPEETGDATGAGEGSSGETGAQDDGKGCGCDASAGAPGLAGLVGLGLLGRRRRR